MRTFKIVVLTPPGEPNASMAIAASRAGGLGVLNLEYTNDGRLALEQIGQLAGFAINDFGLKLDGQNPQFLEEISGYLVNSRPEKLRYLILTSGSTQSLRKYVRTYHELGLKVFLESICLRQAQIGKEVGADGIIAKGHEAGGKIGEETSFILIQKLRPHLSLPLWVCGGIGLHTAAACYTAGADGVVLDSQLLLTKESPLPYEVKKRLASLDGSETVCLGERLNMSYRVFGRPNLFLIKEMLEREQEIDQIESTEKHKLWRELIRRRVSQPSLDENLLPLGQDICFASSLARRFSTVGGVVQGIQRSIEQHLASAGRTLPLREGSPFAQSHLIQFPIVQGPMARISDNPEFAVQVAENGALPFIELAMMRKEGVESLLSACKHKMAGRPWGVGMLGFVSSELFKEQLEVVTHYRPSYALIAGGRPEQVKSLETQGIPTYLHCPSPELLKIFLAQGLRRFIFEGLESGGHLGPRTSFTLWERCLEELLTFLSNRQDASTYQVLFAGGIHDALSAAMISVLAAPLAELGVQVGVQVGSAYLFTKEAVSSGAIVNTYQEQALSNKNTVRLEASPGYVTRCLQTPSTQLFLKEKQRMLSEGRSVDEVRETLERFNLGRLRLAAKGIERIQDQTEAEPQYISVNEEEQVSKGIYMMGQMVGLRDKATSIEKLHQEISVKGTGRIAKLCEEEKNPPKSGKADDRRIPDIAIIGMACVLPKASNLQAYWENILNKVCAIQEIPQDRWDYRSYYHQDRKTRDKIYSKWGGFIDEVPFDPMEYGMPPNSLHSIEPLHLITLQVVREALKDAGYLERSFPRDRTSVIIGAGGGVADLGIKYSLRSFLPLMEQESNGTLKADQCLSSLRDFLPEWTEDSFPGILMNVAAGRVANRFDLGGSNFTVDAACASSMAAVYLAVKELQTYTSDMVVVGGSDTMQNPFTFLCFSKTQALSPSGQSRPLDDQADGIVLGEGVGILLLKRLEDAERDGDRIYAVIKAVGSSSDGKDKCLTAPRPEGQVLALQRAYQQAGVDPSTIGLIETHGTGTVVGDRTEVQAISQVFRQAGAQRQSCAIGAVKSMIGHTKCTAGVAGLMKVALALYTKMLPPTIGVTKPNQKVNFSQTPFYVNTETRPWFKGPANHPRRAGASAFGFGGTNFHAVLEEYTGGYAPSQNGLEKICSRWPQELCLWQAESPEALGELLMKTKKTLEGSSTPKLVEVAYDLWQSLTMRNQPDSSAALRLAVIAQSINDLGQKLDRVQKLLSSSKPLSCSDPQGIYLTEASSRIKGKVAYLFPGQGAQYPGMGKEATLNFSEAFSCLERIDHILGPCLGKRLSDYLFPVPVFTEEEKTRQQEELTRTRIAQPAIGAISVAFYHLLSAFGLSPDLVAGHSYGEYVALWAAGSLTEESLLRVSEARGRIIEEAVGDLPGMMAAIKASARELTPLLAGKEGVWMANYNSPDQTVISGVPSVIQELVKEMGAKSWQAKVLPVACAFHSPLVKVAQEAFTHFLNSVEIKDAAIPVYSNTTALAHSHQAAEIRSQLINHLTHPVSFQQEIEKMYEDGARLFVEVGPRNILTNLVSRILQGQPHLSIAIDQSGRSGLLSLQHCLAQLVVQGLPLNLERLFLGRIEKNKDWLKAKEISTSPSLSSTTWLIRGDRIRPGQPITAAKEKKQPEQASKEPKPYSGKTSPEKEKRMPMDHLGQKMVPLATNLPGLTPGEDTSLSPNGWQGQASDQVMHQFQQMMNKFLETQKEVMLRYLQKGSLPIMDSPKEDNLIPHNAGLQIPLSMSGKAEKAQRNDGGEQRKETEAVSLTDSVSILEQAAPAQAAPAKEKILEILLAIVSERTGYPREMLDCNLDMEADLGIDSIKRVEILGSFQRELTTLAGVRDMEKEIERLSGVKTLQGIIDLVMQGLEIKPSSGSEKMAEPFLAEKTKEKEQETASSARHLTQANGQIHRFTIEAVNTPLSPLRSIGIDKGEIKTQLNHQRVILMTEDEVGLAALLANSFQEQGYRVVRVKVGEKVEELEPGYYSAPFEDYDEIISLVKGIQQQQGPIGAFLHLYPLQKTKKTLEELNLAQWKKLLKLEVKSLFYFAKALESDLKEAAMGSGSCFLAAVSMNGTFGCEASSKDIGFSPSQGGCAGFVKSLKYEWPEVNCKVVDLNLNEEPKALIGYLMNEMQGGWSEVEVGYRQGKRLTLQLKESSLPLEGQALLTIDSSWVLLITGGARGITADVAKELAGKYQPTIVLLGSSAWPKEAVSTDLRGSIQEVKARLIEEMKAKGEQITPARIEQLYHHLMKIEEMRKNKQAMEDSGALVHYYQVDVRNEESLTKIIKEVYERFGKIDGVIHGAGIIEDKLVKDKAVDSFDRVFDTKVDSAFILSRSLQSESLKFLIFFSSVAGRFGNRGQSDYAAANEVLNKMAGYLDSRQSARIVSLNWGPWENSNMVSPLLQKEFAKQGVQLISRMEGPKFVEQEISFGHKAEAEVIIGGSKWTNHTKEAKPKAGHKLPLLDNCTTLFPNQNGQVEVIRELDSSKDRYLLDHCLDGHPVLPMTMALELMVEVVSLGWPDWHIDRICNLHVLKGIVVSSPIKVRLIASVWQHDSLKTRSIKVEMRDFENPSRSYYSVVVEISKRVDEQVAWQPSDLAEAKPFPMSTKEAYEKWLFHGPLFQGIEEINQIGANGIQGVFIPSDPKELLAGRPEGAWLIDPVIVDSGLQMIILWSRTYWDMMPLPSGFRQFRRFAPLAGAKIHFQSRILPKSTPGMLHADLAFFDEKGKLLALLEDMEAACSKSLNRLAEKEKVER